MNWQALLQLAQALARIVAAVHARGIVHRHISPATIALAGPKRQPLLAQFELASTSAESWAAHCRWRVKA